MRCTSVIAAVVLLSLAGAATSVHAVEMDWVTVGDPGNAADTRYETPGYGGVAYDYKIGKYEVTNRQYVEFLNAVAATDNYGLYNTEMLSSSYGCKIEQTGSPGSYSYSVAGDWADRPVNFVSWGDAARFSNWLHNGQLTGAQGPATTEDGSYFLDGATSDAALLAIVREPDATWVIPSEDEWYKAAYYDGGSGVYHDYPTGTDDPPSNVLSNPDAYPGNKANFYDSGYTIGSPYYLTVVGEFENSPSAYGTFDQGGNVWEWNEAIPHGSYRGLRGGSFNYYGSYLHAASGYYSYPSDEYGFIGFRVAEVPEPATLIMLAVGAAALLRRKRS